MSEIIERVARALHKRMAGGRVTWDELSLFSKAAARDVARAAILAMREPTEAMVYEAMTTAYPTVKEAGGMLPQAKEAARLEWQAMIDAALTE